MEIIHRYTFFRITKNFSYYHTRIKGFFVLFCFFFFSSVRGGRIKIPLLEGHHRPASDTPFKWRVAGVPIMALY